MTGETKNFTVVIPLYNKRESIGATINTVLQQTYPHFELLVIDDGSTDGSAEIVSGFNDERIRLIRQANSGVSAARNCGIRSSLYDLIAFLDADDLWEPDYLKEMSGFIEVFPSAGMYGSAYDFINDNERKSIVFYLEKDYQGVIANYFYHAENYHLFCSSAVIIKKVVTEKAGFFDERMSLGEDLDFWLRIAYHYEVAFYNKVLAHYNLGLAGRAMLKKHPFANSHLNYTDAYKAMEDGDPAFRHFINVFRLRKIPEVFKDYDIGKEQFKSYLKTINPEGQKWKHKLFLMMPYAFQRIIISAWLNSASNNR